MWEFKAGNTFGATAFSTCFAIFNTYMLIWSARINLSVLLVFFTLEITEILLAWGNFNGDHAGSRLVSILPVGSALWSDASQARAGVATAHQ